MSQSIKAVLQLIMLMAVLAGAGAWLLEDRPNFTVWCFRIGAPAVALTMLAAIWAFNLRRDLAPDYLRQVAGDGFFNRNGFTFAPSAVLREGVCCILVHFQNQQDQPAVAKVGLRTAERLLRRSYLEEISFQIHCEPAAFGVAIAPIALAPEFLGKKHVFDVGASVAYPQGKGRRLRFRDGTFLRTNADFTNPLRVPFLVGGLMVGKLILTEPAKLALMLPDRAADRRPARWSREVRTLWRLGDAPLTPEAIASSWSASPSHRRQY